MKYKCDMIKDLMPLCMDEAASDTSKNIVVEHLAECKKCEKYYDNMDKEIQIDTPIAEETKGYITVARKLRKRKLMIRLCIGLIVGITFEFLLFYAIGYRFTAESAADLSGRLNNSSKLIGNYDWGDWEFYFYSSESSYDVVTVKKHWNGWKAQDNYLIWPKYITDKGGVINAGSIYYWTDTAEKYGIQIMPLIIEDKNVASVEVTVFNETKSIEVKTDELNFLIFENKNPNLGNSQSGYGYDAAGNIIYKLTMSDETLRYKWEKVDPQITTIAGDMNNLYGSYAFDKSIYVNPISSMAYIDIKEYYTFSEDSFYLINGYNKEEFNVTYEKEEVTEEKFKSSFSFDMGFPGISSYKVRNQYTLKSNNSSSYYRLYEMDEELWLAKINKGAKNDPEKEIIWNIAKLTKIKEGSSKVVNIAGIKNNTEEFEKNIDDKQFNLVEGETCFNITPQDILSKTNNAYTVYKYNESCASFLLYNNQIYQLGIWFGALGVTSMETADLNKDGLDEFYFTYSFGSGLHRSMIGYFDPATNEIETFDYSYENEELLMTKNEEGRLLLYTAKVEEFTDFAHFNLRRNAFVTEIVFEKNQIALRF